MMLFGCPVLRISPFFFFFELPLKKGNTRKQSELFFPLSSCYGQLLAWESANLASFRSLSKEILYCVVVFLFTSMYFVLFHTD